MLPKGLSLLKPLTAAEMAEFAADTSFWIDVRMLLKVLDRKLLN